MNDKSEFTDRFLWLAAKGPQFYFTVSLIILFPLLGVAYYLDKEHEADIQRLEETQVETYDKYMIELHAIRDELAEVKKLLEEKND